MKKISFKKPLPEPVRSKATETIKKIAELKKQMNDNRVIQESREEMAKVEEIISRPWLIGYCYDDNFIFSGETIIQPCPINKDQYLWPPNCTDLLPPEPKPGHVVKFDVDKKIWKYVKNNLHEK